MVTVGESQNSELEVTESGQKEFDTLKKIRDILTSQFFEVMKSMGLTLKNELTDDVALLETGMDSLGFAVLVARLEQELGYDPFVLMDTPFYPKTWKDFIDIYEKFEGSKKI